MINSHDIKYILQSFLSHSIQSHTLLTHHQMSTVSNEILTAIRHVITNSAALVAASGNVLPLSETPTLDSPNLNNNNNNNNNLIQINGSTG